MLVALAAPAIARWDPLALDVKSRLSPPSATHWMGTDDVGRDAWSRVIYGARLSMLVGGSVVLLSFVGGAPLRAPRRLLPPRSTTSSCA